MHNIHLKNNIHIHINYETTMNTRRLLNFYKTSTLCYRCGIDVLQTPKRRLVTMWN